MSTLLILIYNCYDQVLSARERRLAKSREAAAKHARETVQARERWKLAKDVAKKGAAGLQKSMSRTFSRRKSGKGEELKTLGLAKLNTDDTESSSTSQQEPSSLPTMSDSTANDPKRTGDKNTKKPAAKGKHLHTQSKIYKYAYGQLEKEKAMQETGNNLSFSGVISMATGGEVRRRPPIEVAFKDLTLTLKGKNKHILRSVSGKIMPGRVSAVMGPSGAGKTTFLSALGGKIRGCSKIGSILINGKPDSIHCYKKIIGYVPQDDIVHGNLTVEENLGFSAGCRYVKCLQE